MLRIVPDSFARHTCEEIYACLLNSGETSFEVVLNRMRPEPTLEEFILILDYQAALYAGELLSRLSTEFCYKVPLENSNAAFYFRFSTNNIEQLAATIFHVASAAECLADSDRWYNYELEKNEFCSSCFADEDEYVPVCEGYLPIIWNLFEKC